MEIRYNAIILKKKEVGETDRFYTLYTLEQGKVQLMAKGVRKPEAKLAGQLETLTQGLVIAVKGNGMGKIAGAVAENNFFHLRNDADILKRVLETVNIFERLIDFDEPDAQLFQLLAAYLAISDDLAKEKQAEKVMLMAEGFLFQLFARLGYTIETGACVVSGKKLQGGEKHFFSPSAGGVLAGEHIHNTQNAFPVSESAIKLMRIFLSNKLESLTRVKVNEKEFREVRQAANLFFEWIRA